MEITKQLKCDIDFNQTELTTAIRKHQVSFLNNQILFQPSIKLLNKLDYSPMNNQILASF